MRLNYARLEYDSIEKISKIVIEKLLQATGRRLEDIEEVAWYKYGPYSKQPLIVFFKDGTIYKIKASLKIERLK